MCKVLARSITAHYAPEQRLVVKDSAIRFKFHGTFLLKNGVLANEYSILSDTRMLFFLLNVQGLAYGQGANGPTIHRISFDYVTASPETQLICE